MTNNERDFFLRVCVIEGWTTTTTKRGNKNIDRELFSGCYCLYPKSYCERAEGGLLPVRPKCKIEKKEEEVIHFPKSNLAEREKEKKFLHRQNHRHPIHPFFPFFRVCVSIENMSKKKKKKKRVSFQ